MLTSLFEFLFKYRPVVFQEGDFSLGAAGALTTGAVIAGLVGALALLTYWGVRGKTRSLDRWVLGGLRFAGLAVLAFCLLRPALVVSTVVPQQNFVGVLLDDSRSMEIPDYEGRSRGSFLQETFGTPDSPVLAALSDRFAVRFFRFSSRTDRIDNFGEMSFTGSRTRLGPALERARSELASVPLSGLVLVTDGADNSGEELSEALMPLQAQGIPVYTVGVGEESFDRDIQVSRADPPRTVLTGSSVVVDVVVTHAGYEGETVSLIVEDEGQIVSTEEVELPQEGQPVTVPVRFSASTSGPRAYTFRIPVEDDEQVTQNNSQTALVSVEDRREKILYFEGEPRYEVGFLGRAVADDDNLQLVVLQRTAENKFLRLNVDDGEELQGGFPDTRAELYAYRSLVLGTVEASFFTGDQLQMIADFVDKRGGSLLALGGRNSFARGGYAGTPVADVLPVVFSDADARPDGYHAFVKVEPTQAGLAVPALQLADTGEESGARWSELPFLLTYNPLHRVKPGATDAAPGRLGGARRGACRARLPALRRGQEPEPGRAGHLDLANAAPARRRHPRDLLATDAALAGGRRTRPGDERSAARPRGTRGKRDARGDRERLQLPGPEQQPGGGHGDHPSGRGDRARAGLGGGRPRRRIRDGLHPYGRGAAHADRARLRRRGPDWRGRGVLPGGAPAERVLRRGRARAAARAHRRRDRRHLVHAGDDRHAPRGHSGDRRRRDPGGGDGSVGTCPSCCCSCSP